jgi:DNA-binding FrmR family transcriptional regulator
MKEDTPVRSETNLHYDKTMLNRLKRLEGQVRGVIRMMEEGKDCRGVTTFAVRSASVHLDYRRKKFRTLYY